MRRQLIPSVSFEDPVNEFACRDRDKVRGLLYLNMIVAINEDGVGQPRLVLTREHKAFTSDVIYCFGYVFVRTSKRKFINVAEEKNFETSECGGVNSMVMGGAFEVELW